MTLSLSFFARYKPDTLISGNQPPTSQATLETHTTYNAKLATPFITTESGGAPQSILLLAWRQLDMQASWNPEGSSWGGQGDDGIRFASSKTRNVNTPSSPVAMTANMITLYSLTYAKCGMEFIVSKLVSLSQKCVQRPVYEWHSNRGGNGVST